KMREEQKAMVLQKYARAWLARRRFQNIRRFVLNIQLSYRVQQLQKRIEEQSRENHGLLERLTNLASAHMNDVDTIQKLESELEKLTAQKRTYEEKGKKYKEDSEQVIIATCVLLFLNNGFEILKYFLTEKMDDLTQQLFNDVQKEENQRMILEKNFQNQKQDYEKEIELLKGEIKILKEEKTQLQQQIQQEIIIQDGLKMEVGQLTKQAQKIPELQKEIELLQTQKLDVEKQAHSQKRELREKMSEVTKQLLESYDFEDVRSRLSTEDLEHLNEDGELWFAYEGLKKATRVLESHFQSQKEIYEKEIEGLNFKVEHLSQDINHLQKLFREENDINDGIRLEVSRLTSENLVIPDLKQQVAELENQKLDLENRLQEQTIKLKGNGPIMMSNRLHYELERDRTQRRTTEAQNEVDIKEKESLKDTIQGIEGLSNGLMQDEIQGELQSKIKEVTTRLAVENMTIILTLNLEVTVLLCLPAEAHVPAVPKEYIGMMEYKKEDEERIIQNLILDLKPRGVVVNMIPGLPAHILFMCVRYADYLNDADMLKSFMNVTIDGIKQVVKEHAEDFEMLSFWLSNTYYFLNCLKQYSGEEEFMKHNTPRQNKNCLKHFDLSEYRQILSDLAIQIYHQFIIVMENNIQHMIVPGMLEYESLQGISGLKPTGFRKRSSSIDDTDTYTMTSILQQLSYFYSTMCQNGLDSELLKQAVKQLFFLIGAVTLNSLFLRKDMCSCRKGMQIRCNISYLEEWLKDKNLQSSNAKETLEPLSQAAWLLQVKKITDDDAKEICEHCTSLSTVQQIVKILNSYTPIDDFEKRVTPSFVRKVQAMLNNREDVPQLMLDTKHLFQVTFPFTPSPHALELIQVPSSFKLGFLTRV
ncbi:MYO5C protein, partial [Rhodinocichla rosea]|nr:MYO5C protein [Rhodinocichla rosea]